MGHQNRNRGKESNDDRLFGPKLQAIFTIALDDYCYLLTRGYGQKSSVALVGNRYKLNVRQQQALRNMGASESQIQNRTSKLVSEKNLAGKTLELDGFNILIILESALSGAYVFKGRDRFYRDISSVHGGYKRVSKTEEVIEIIGRCLAKLEVLNVRWILDQPVSNSGRLGQFIMEVATKKGWKNWDVELDHNPDRVLAASEQIVVSSDAWVLDESTYLFNLAGYILDQLEVDLNILQP